MHSRAVLVLITALLAAPAELRAQGGESLEQMATWAEAAEAAEAELEYERALELWNTVIAHPAVTRDLRMKASVHAGSIERIRGNQLQARVHFMYVLDQDINYLLPASTEPKIEQFFEMIRAEMREKARVESAGAEATGGDEVGGEEEVAGDGPGALAFVGGGALGAALIVGGLAATLGVLSNEAQDEAMNSTVQVDRVDLYDDRDLFANLANGGWVIGGVLVVVGASLLAVDLLSGE